MASDVVSASSSIIVSESRLIYTKGLCARGDLAPLVNLASVSSPASNFRCIRIAIALSASLAWEVNAMGASRTFPRAGDVNKKGPYFDLPPPIGGPPQRGRVTPRTCDLRNYPPSKRGGRLIRHFYGARDAPARQFLAPSQRLRALCNRQLKTDVCYVD